MASTRAVMLVLSVTTTACQSDPDNMTDADGSTDGSTGEPTGSEGESTGTTTGDASDDTSMEATIDLPGVHFVYDIWPILEPNCSCHIVTPEGMPPGGIAYPFLGEEPGGAYLALVDQSSTVAGLDYVEPGDPATSYLFHKVSGTQSDVGGSGTAMPPPPAAMLTSDELAKIQEWIAMGALE